MLKQFQQLETFFKKPSKKPKQQTKQFGRFTVSIHINHLDVKMLQFSYGNK